MTFVLTEQRSKHLFPPPADEFQPAKILKHSHRATTEDFDPFLRIRFVTVGQIADRALRPVREAKRTDHVIVAVFARVGKAMGLRFNRRSAHQESQEVHKMADFPDDASAALFRIIQPVIGRNEAGIHAVMQRQGLMNSAKKTLEPKRERGEPAVETDNKKRLANRLLVLVYPHDLAQLIFIQTQRLFAEDVLAGLQGCQHLSGMQVMTSGDDDCVDRQIADQSVFIGGTVVKSELLRDGLGMGAVGGTHADQRHTTNSFYRRQQRAGGEATRSEQSDSNRFRGGNGGRSTLPGHCYTPGFLGKLRISNQDSEEILLRLARD